MQSNPTSLPHEASPATNPPDWLSLDRQLCFALYATSLAMTKRYRSVLEPLGLTYPQYLVMLALWEQDGRSVGDLGAVLSLDSGTLTPLLKRLESQGLLSRQRSHADERRVEVYLSEAGRALRAQALPIPGQMACALGCSLEHISALTQQLHQLRQGLKELHGLNDTSPPAP